MPVHDEMEHEMHYVDIVFDSPLNCDDLSELVHGSDAEVLYRHLTERGLKYDEKWECLYGEEWRIVGIRLTGNVDEIRVGFAICDSFESGELR